MHHAPHHRGGMLPPMHPTIEAIAQPTKFAGPGGRGRRHHGFGGGPGHGHGWWGGHHSSPGHRGGWHPRQGRRPRGSGSEGEPSVVVSTWRTDNTVMTRVVREGNQSRMSYTAKIAQELALQVIQSEEINPSETEVLDFGFESGGKPTDALSLFIRQSLTSSTEFNASIVLQPHVKSVVGAAVSASAVGAYNDHATRAHVSPDAMQAIALPFMGHLSSLKGKLFDVIVVSQPIDQRPDIAIVLPALAAQFLKPGGSLFVTVLDMNKSPVVSAADGNPESPAEEDAYEDQRVEAIFHDAALEGFELIANDAYGAGHNEPGRLFFAVGYKPVPEDFDLVDDDMSTTASSTA